MIVLAVLALLCAVIAFGLCLAVLAGNDPFLEDRRRP